MALTGDAIITRKLSVYNEPPFLEMIKIIRSADVAFTNFEMLLHDYEPYPMHKSGGTYMRAEPSMAKELIWAGFDIVSTANNHTGDYGSEGMRLTLKYLNDYGLVNAGAGESLEEAREAKFIETSKARVALISCASTFPDHSRAGTSRGDTNARPGLSPLRFKSEFIITKNHFDNIKKLKKAIEPFKFSKDDKNSLTEINFSGRNYKVGSVNEVITKTNKKDLKEIERVVKSSIYMADYTIVTIHAHESNQKKSVPAKFLIEFSRKMVDAGADVVVGHGPHVLRGVEIYKGKPIFYSLANFIFQNETLLRVPEENYAKYDLGTEAQINDWNSKRYANDTRGFPTEREIWESVIAVPKWNKGNLFRIELYPISLGFGEKRTIRGRPMLANKALSKKIINDLAERSKPFGTKVEFKDGIGVINIVN
tara:strand:- start:1343 stop:2614 length:1272 start_codon:yes stop_codon:yes gene_type:complete